MRGFLSNVKFYLKRRFSGENERHIKSIEESLKTLLPTSVDYWLAWYREYLENLLKILKINRFIPQRYYISAKNALAKLTKDNNIIFKEIVLPFPQNTDEYFGFVQGAFDSLWTYLLEDLDGETRNSLFPCYMEGAYEYKAVKLEKGDIVIDAGAHIGEFSALAGVKGCKAYAFEPIPYVIETYLSETAKINPNITVCQYALSDKLGELEFSLNGLSSSSISNKNGAQIKVQAIDLDTFAEENKLPSVDFIKADIEGAERCICSWEQSGC